MIVVVIIIPNNNKRKLYCINNQFFILDKIYHNIVLLISHLNCNGSINSNISGSKDLFGTQCKCHLPIVIIKLFLP